MEAGCTGGELETPATAIVVVLHPAGRHGSGKDVTVLEGINAGPGLGFSGEVRVPQVPDGRYVFVGSSDETGPYESEPFRIRRSAGSN